MIIDAMTRLEQIDSQVRKESGDINHPGIGIYDANNAYMDLISGKGDTATTVRAMKKSIDSTLNRSDVPGGVKAELLEIRAQIAPYVDSRIGDVVEYNIDGSPVYESDASNAEAVEALRGRKGSKGAGKNVESNAVDQPELSSDVLIVANDDFLDSTGKVDWEKHAPNGGYVLGTRVEGQELRKGKIIDRFGNKYGRYVSPFGTPYEQRSLPYIENPNAYHKYEVLKPIKNVSMGVIKSAFNQPGRGIQYELLIQLNG